MDRAAPFALEVELVPDVIRDEPEDLRAVLRASAEEPLDERREMPGRIAAAIGSEKFLLLTRERGRRSHLDGQRRDRCLQPNRLELQLQ